MRIRWWKRINGNNGKDCVKKDCISIVVFVAILPYSQYIYAEGMTTALFMLRCVELGLNIADLDLLTIGSVNDMFNEKSRDSMEWKEQAAQSDFDKF